MCVLACLRTHSSDYDSAHIASGITPLLINFTESSKSLCLPALSNIVRNSQSQWVDWVGSVNTGNLLNLLPASLDVAEGESTSVPSAAFWSDFLHSSA